MNIYTHKVLPVDCASRRDEKLAPAGAGGGASFAHLFGQSRRQPRAILFRQIATPNYEFRHFLNICARSGYAPTVLQYHADKMSCHNTYKRSLVAPMFVEGIDRHGKPYFRRERLVKFEEVEKLCLADVSVASQTLPTLHNNLLRLALPDAQFDLVDGSPWFCKYPGGASEYYVDLFSALTGDLLLIEDFVTDGEEERFFKKTVRPAFDLACANLGKRPVIHRLCDNRRSSSPLWYAYPASYRTLFNRLGCKF